MVSKETGVAAAIISTIGIIAVACITSGAYKSVCPTSICKEAADQRTSDGVPTTSSPPSTSPSAGKSTSAPPPLIVKIVVTAVNGTYSGPCPPPPDATTYEATISVNTGPVTVRFRWMTSNGGDTDPSEKTVDFPGSGPQQVSVRHNEALYLPKQTKNDWIAVKLISPAGPQSNKVAYSLKCTT